MSNNNQMDSKCNYPKGGKNGVVWMRLTKINLKIKLEQEVNGAS